MPKPSGLKDCDNFSNTLNELSFQETQSKVYTTALHKTGISKKVHSDLKGSWAANVIKTERPKQLMQAACLRHNFQNTLP